MSATGRSGQGPTAPPPTLAAVAAMAGRIRRRVFAHVLEQGGGYLSQACSSAELLALLYGHLMHLGPSEGPLMPAPFGGVPAPGRRGSAGGGRYNGPRRPELDRFVFSPVHYALTLYATLIEVGRLAPEALADFNRDGSTLEMIGAEHSPGIELTAGSLGQALSQAAGIALGRTLKGDSGLVWVLMSDGEFQEGQTWEAFAALAFHRIDNLRVLIDANGRQCDGAIGEVMAIEPLGARLRAFGASVAEVDGHDLEALARAARLGEAGRPRVLICRTDPARDVPLLRDRGRTMHHLRFRNDAERKAYRAAYEALCAAADEAPR